MSAGAHKTPSRSDDAPLLALMRAVAAGDEQEAARLLNAAPELTRRALNVAASRQAPDGYFFREISHYAYAGDTALHLAAAAHRLATVKQLLAKGALVGARNRRGALPLHYAADGVPGSAAWAPEAQAAVIALLIGAGADPNAIDKSGVAPLHRAVRTRCSAAVRALLANGAKVNQKSKSGSTPLQLAVQDTGRGGSGSAIARQQQQQIIELLKIAAAAPAR